jgi:hypothetical protein
VEVKREVLHAVLRRATIFFFLGMQHLYRLMLTVWFNVIIVDIEQEYGEACYGPDYCRPVHHGGSN